MYERPCLDIVNYASIFCGRLAKLLLSGADHAVCMKDASEFSLLSRLLLYAAHKVVFVVMASSMDLKVSKSNFQSCISGVELVRCFSLRQ